MADDKLGDDVKIVYNPDTGITSNYFGGKGGADGVGHGHVDVNEDGEVVEGGGKWPFGRDSGVRD